MIDHNLILMDHNLIMIDNNLIIIENYLIMINHNLIMIDNHLIMIDDDVLLDQTLEGSKFRFSLFIFKKIENPQILLKPVERKKRKSLSFERFQVSLFNDVIHVVVIKELL